MKLLISLVLFLSIGTSIKAEEIKTPPFRLHLLSEPTTLSPFLQKNSNSLYFLGQVSAPLLRLDKGELSPYTAQCVQAAGKRIECTLLENYWSDGSPVEISDYINTFRAFADPKNAAFKADLLSALKNYKKVIHGELSPRALGVREVKAKKTNKKSPPQKDKLVFDLENEDLEFIFNLASPLLTPLKNTQFGKTAEDLQRPSAGPYKIKSWVPGEKIVLTNNPNFIDKTNRPDVQFTFIVEDTVSLNLYEKDQLDFVRRVPTTFIPKYKSRADFYEIPVFRFDYIGFGPALKDFLELRKALSLAVPYDDLVKLYSAKPRPGCPGLPSAMMKSPPCHNFNLEEAQKVLSTLAASLRSSGKKIPNLSISFSKQGSDDHVRSMEYFQSSWRKNLHLEVSMNQMDNKAFVELLEKNEAPLFRKGLSPDRPTCRAVLSTFAEDSNTNYLNFSSISSSKKDKTEDLNEIIERMAKTKSLSQSRELCQKGLSLLIDNYHLIPLGPMYFSVLAKPEWTGWNLNELNQLDLSRLEYKKNR